jgi:hypothetical protein
MAPAQGWCVVVESRRAARARSEESDRDPDGSSPAECGETDRRAFVVVARRHTITLKSYTVFFCVSVCVIFPFFRGVAYTRRAVLPRARGLDATRRRATDGGRFGGDGRPASIFFLRRPPSFVRHEGPPIVRSRRARARARARRPARESPARRRRRATGRDGGDREVRARFPETDRGGERGGGRARARGGEATSARTRGDDWHGGVSDDGGARGADSDVARRANV